MALPGDTFGITLGDEAFDRPPPYMGTTFNHLCSLWVIVREMVDAYYDGDRGGSALVHADLDFAQGIYQRLLAWADQLPMELARSSQSPHHIVMAHIFFHVTILNLFRPFMHDDRRSLYLYVFASPHATPSAAFNASLNQLRRLAHIFWDTFACASYALLWHPALLQVANGALRGSGDPQTGTAAFRACLAGYLALGRGYPVARSVAKGLLAMAVRADLLDLAEARRAAGDGGPLRDAPHGSQRESEMQTLVVDLDLALVDRSG